MTTVNNKNYTVINIEKNQGLSQAIDKTLDLEFKTDIQLSADTWQSIFDKIKEEQIEQTSKQKQFGDSDTNVNNGKHYIVQAGKYRISNVVWDFIKQKAQEWLNANNKQNDNASEASQTTTVAQQASTSATTPASSEASNKRKADPAKAQVEEILCNNNIDTSDISISDVVRKYNLILDYNRKNGITTDQTVLENRIVNYAKGLKYHNFETKAQTDNNAEFQSDCSKAKSLEDLAKSYQQFGKEYVEFMDQDGDGEINVHEMFYQELIDRYTQENLENHREEIISNDKVKTFKAIKQAKIDAKKKALETLEKFKNYNLNNLPDENSELYNTNEMELFTTVMKKVGLLDADKNGQISSDEAGAYLMFTAQSLDSKNNIQAAEATQMERGIAADGYNVKDLQKLDYTEQEAKNILSFTNNFKKKFSTYLEFVKTGKMPQQ